MDIARWGGTMSRETEVRRIVSSAVVDVVVMVIVGGGKDVVDIIVIAMIMKVNSEVDRVVIRVEHARRKMGSERVLTIISHVRKSREVMQLSMLAVEVVVALAVLALLLGVVVVGTVVEGSRVVFRLL